MYMKARRRLLRFPFNCIESCRLCGCRPPVLYCIPRFAPTWTMVFAVLAAVTMTVGNLLALPQTNIKRLLAYSSISHAVMP